MVAEMQGKSCTGPLQRTLLAIRHAGGIDEPLFVLEQSRMSTGCNRIRPLCEFFKSNNQLLIDRK